ncbi:MAG: GAF domain-containing protein [Nitrospirae bacterium]|nr:GAF domain-containing protein [Nitrospirota bacterium]
MAKGMVKKIRKGKRRGNTRRERELSALHEIIKSMQTLNLDEILHLILEGVTETIGFDRARLYLINETEKVLECRMAVGVEREKIQNISLPIDKENSIVARAVIEKKPFVISDALNDPRVNLELKKHFNLKSFAAVPLLGKDKVRGAVTADNLTTERRITAGKMASLVTFSHQAGLALENAKMYEELKSFSKQLEERVKAATEDLRRSQEQLIQSGKLAALGQLSAGIAHEIRNPLTSIKILIHSLINKLQEDEGNKKKDILVIESEIERMNQTIKRFLDFARPAEPTFSSLGINQVLEQTLPLVSHELREGNIRLYRKFSSELPEVLADRDQLRQVFLNLILNAVQAMPEGGSLTIATKVTSDRLKRAEKELVSGIQEATPEGDFIGISFTDTGCGIPPEKVSDIFDPFFTAREEGIGLGLSITHRIIDNHQGSIKVNSREGEGTTFTVIIPVKRQGSMKNAECKM